MRPIPLTATVLGGIAALALTGCSPNQTGGTPTTANSTTATSSAPAIANPLDTTKLQQNLCAGLTPVQLAAYVGKVRKTNVDNDAKCAKSVRHSHHSWSATSRRGDPRAKARSR